MKITYRIPTDAYAYVEVEEGFGGWGDEDDMVNPKKIRDHYDSIADAFKKKEEPEPGLPEKAFNQFIDNQLLGENNELEDYNNMSPQQQEAAQVIKRALKRIKAKEL